MGQCGMDAMKQEMENLRREVCACNLDRTDKDGESRAAESLDKPPVSGIDGSRMMEKLGLTAEEYAVFCRDGVRALERMLDAQKRDCRFRIYQLAFEAGETVPFAFKGILDLYKAGYEQPPAAKYRLAADSTLTCPAEWTDTEILKRLSACFGSRVPEKEKGCMEHPLASSDVVELKDEAGRRYFYVDGSDFEPVRFSPFLAKPMEKPVQSQRAADV
nr:YodL domain-containing protein [uncultured Acetatifactor sp.]